MPEFVLQTRKSALLGRPIKNFASESSKFTVRLAFLVLAQCAFWLSTPVFSQEPGAPVKSPDRTASVEAAGNPTVADTHLPELTQVAQIRSLSAEQAARGYPVRVTGVLTYNDPNPINLVQFIQDNSGGIYMKMDKRKFAALPTCGHQVEITGFTGPGEFAPVIYAVQLSVLGESPFPTPKPAILQALMTGGEDSQWISLTGMIRTQSTNDVGTSLNLSVGDAVVSLVVPKGAGRIAPKNYVDALVEVQGVCGTIFDDKRRLQGIRVFVPTFDQIQVKEAAAEDSFSLPLRPIGELLQFYAGGGGPHRSHVRGIVILRQADDSFYLQDASGGVLVQPQKPAPQVEVGQNVELIGFPSIMNQLPVLQEAVAKLASGKAVQMPAPISSESPLDESLHGTLVQLTGRMVGHSTSTTEESLTVQYGGSIIDAILEKKQSEDLLGKIASGSLVSLVGVYAARLDDSRKIRSFQLLLRSKDDVIVKEHPSWWTAQHTYWVLGGSVTSILLVLGWAGALRKQVRERTRELRDEIEERKRMEAKVEKTHKELMIASRQAGMAEVATSVLHNVGNVLNSVNVSASLIANQIRDSRVGNVERVAGLLKEHEQNLADFLTGDPKGRQLPSYLQELSKHLTQERGFMQEELQSLNNNVEHIKSIVAMQQSYAKIMGVAETVRVEELVESALHVNTAGLERHGVKVERAYDNPALEITVDRHKVLQILINLISNAKYACDESNRPDKHVLVRVGQEQERIRISVTDNGVGILPENKNRIFNHGFTTRKTGHGFGLHSGALTAKELGGTLAAESEGPGKGSTFILELPLKPNKPNSIPDSGSAK